MRMRSLTRAGIGAAVVVSAMLLLGACGDSDAGSATFVEPTALAPQSTTSTAPTTVPPTTTTTLPPLQLTNSAKISTAGLGPVRIGMTVKEAERLTGVTLVADEIGDNSCRYHVPDRGVTGVGFMVADGEVVRVDVWEGAISTLSGIGIGSTADEITELFGTKLETQTHPYDPDGQYLVLVPVDKGDADKRVIWEIDAEGLVTAFRAGRVPYVEFIEGCS
ncbi:MAG: hypothetical protein ACKVHU_16550 [Acidimicrobiales bacterium]